MARRIVAADRIESAMGNQPARKSSAATTAKSEQKTQSFSSTAFTALRTLNADEVKTECVIETTARVSSMFFANNGQRASFFVVFSLCLFSCLCCRLVVFLRAI